MTDVTRLLSAVESGNSHAAAQLLPVVYDELRKLAAQKLAHEKPGQTLDATALVHEAYLRLVASPRPSGGEGSRVTGDVSSPPYEGGAGGVNAAQWNNRRHFFAAAAEAMRRILVEKARRKKRQRHGGDCQRVDLPEELPIPDRQSEDVLAVHEALELLAEQDATTAELVKLHYFAGLTIEQAAELLGLSPRSAYRDWSYARAWLFRRLGGDGPAPA